VLCTTQALRTRVSSASREQRFRNPLDRHLAYTYHSEWLWARKPFMMSEGESLISKWADKRYSTVRMQQRAVTLLADLQGPQF